MADDRSREGQLNAVIDPKLLFLAKVAARYKRQTLVEFIEDAFKRALTYEAIDGPHPTPGVNVKRREDERLQFEGCWDENEAARLYLVAVRGLELLTPKQRNLFTRVCLELSKQNKKVTLKNFTDFFE